MSAAIIEELKNASNLRTLVIKRPSGLNKKVLQEIAALPWLKHLEITESLGLRASDWEALVKRSDLSLHLDNVGEVPAAIRTLMLKTAEANRRRSRR